MMEDKYAKMFRDFGLQHPLFHKRTIDWCPSGWMSIIVKLDDGKCYEYDRVDGTLRRVRSKDDTCTEDMLAKELSANLQKNLPFVRKSHAELCEELGISRVMLSRYLHGKATPSATKLYKIAKVLGCTMDQLFDENYME